MRLMKLAVLAVTLVHASVFGGDAVEVQAFGSLMTIMHEGRAPASASLEDWTPSTSWIAVGALSDLRGEITAVDGRLYLARPNEDGSASTTEATASDEQAALLVVAEVPRWIELAISKEVAFDELDQTIRTIAEGAGLDVTRPFPFVIEGPVGRLRWHTIDGRRIEPGAAGHAAHEKAGIREERDETVATLVGFYSDAHQGVFTHRGKQTHVHVVVRDPLSSGHVDHVVVAPGAKLRIPAVKSPRTSAPPASAAEAR